MRDVNEAKINGRLGRDPELKYTPAGLALCKFSIAHNKGKDKKGQERPPMWLDVVVWGDAAETVASQFRKGAPVLVEGRIESHDYEVNGQKRRAFEIVASSVLAVTDAKSGEAGDEDIPL